MIREYRNLILVGTSHISKDSTALIRRVIEERQPQIIAIELDRRRAYGLLTKDKKTDKWYILKKFGLAALIFFVIGEYVQKKLGKLLQIEPGVDMLSAMQLASEKKIPFALIDRDIEITLKRLSKNLTWTDRNNFIKDLFSRDETISFDVSKVPPQELIQKLLHMMKARYPGLYLTLIVERNQIMAKRLIKLSQTHLVVAVVGAGHIEGLSEMLEKQNA